MLTLCGGTVKEETCNAIGRFVILWSQLETVYFNNNYNIRDYERLEVIKCSNEIDNLISGIKDALNSYAGEAYDKEMNLQKDLESSKSIYQYYCAELQYNLKGSDLE